MNKDTKEFSEFLRNNDIGLLPEENGVRFTYSVNDYDDNVKTKVYYSAKEAFKEEQFIKDLLADNENYKTLFATQLEFVNIHSLSVAKFAEDMNVDISREMLTEKDSLAVTIELGDYTKNYLFNTLSKDDLNKLDVDVISDIKLIAEYHNLEQSKLELAVFTADVIETDFKLTSPPLGLKTACFNAVEDFLGQSPYYYLADNIKDVEME